MNAQTPVIALDNIVKRFGDLEVLKGVSLEAHRGDVIVLIGSSGSGKSTLLRCTNLLEIPQQGEILFAGDAIRWREKRGKRQAADDEQVRKMRTSLSMVFQSFNLWSHLTVLENVIEAPITVQKRDRQATIDHAHQLLEKVGIGDKGDFYPSQLSGGQQQRAAIARALAMEPAALLFDEPTSALDPELEAEVIRVIRALAEEGRTMIIVTHDMNMARELASTVIFLHQGVIEEQGPPEDVLQRPKSARLQQFLAADKAN